MRKICVLLKKNVISLLQQGFSYNQVKAKLLVSKATIHRIKCTNLPHLNCLNGGRPRLLSEPNVRHIVRQITSGKLDTAVEASKDLQQHHELKVSHDTVRRALKRAGLRSSVKVKKPLLKPTHVLARLNFARKYQHWTIDDWKRVIWSDESKINRFGSDGKKWCWKTASSQLVDRYVVPTIKHGGGSIMVWGCMTASGTGFLTKIDGGLDADLYCGILEGELLQTIEWYGFNQDTVIFQHDNDPKHTSRKAREWLQNHSFNVLDWPAQSPDLNPIEHLWRNLKTRLCTYDTAPNGVHELWDRVQDEWNKITVEECVKLIESMPRRVAAVIKAKGGHTKY
jgi:transposase